MPQRQRLDVLWHGTVVDVDGDIAHVEIPRLAAGFRVKVTVSEGWWSSTVHTSTNSLHSHTVASPLAIGDDVIVGFLEGNVELAVILGRR
jgi:hypothetical protein